jgi:hypothetical protein
MPDSETHCFEATGNNCDCDIFIARYLGINDHGDRRSRPLRAAEWLRPTGSPRGAGTQPENTLPAFETALDLMVTTLEFDLHLITDRADLFSVDR